MPNNTEYLEMQRAHYEQEASKWGLQNRDPVVGWYDRHNEFNDYDEILFKDFLTDGLIAIEYGCGPGRNLIRYAPRFGRVDGVDIAAGNIEKARLNLQASNVPEPQLFVNDGKSLDFLPDNCYDVAFSVICLQHIPVYQIRYSIMKELYRILKPGGYFCFQMGFGGRGTNPWSEYFENRPDVSGTNGYWDVSITDEDQLKADLINVGFRDYKSDIRDPCCDVHAKWIWVQCRK